MGTRFPLVQTSATPSSVPAPPWRVDVAWLDRDWDCKQDRDGSQPTRTPSRPKLLLRWAGGSSGSRQGTKSTNVRVESMRVSLCTNTAYLTGGVGLYNCSRPRDWMSSSRRCTATWLLCHRLLEQSGCKRLDREPKAPRIGQTNVTASVAFPEGVGEKPKSKPRPGEPCRHPAPLTRAAPGGGGPP